MDFLDNYSEIPDELLNMLSEENLEPYTTCDTECVKDKDSLCRTDEASGCPLDVCNFDGIPCSGDCLNCIDCYDCNDCSDCYDIPRPSNWSWSSTVSSGSKIKISASEWNSFCSRINDFRDYLGYSHYNFTTVYSGDAISAKIVNQARQAIFYMVSSGAPALVSSGDVITASFFNKLKDALNSI